MSVIRSVLLAASGGLLSTSFALSARAQSAATAPPAAAASTAPAAVAPAPAAATSSAPATAAPAASAPSAPPALTMPSAPVLAPASFGKKVTTWDATLEGGYGHRFGDAPRSLYLGRLGAGLLFVRDPNFFSIDLTYEYSTLSSASVGVAAEVMRLDSGVWAMLAACSDLDHGARPGASLSLGWSLFAVEGDIRSRESGAVSAVYGKLRIPLGVIAWGLSQH